MPGALAATEDALRNAMSPGVWQLRRLRPAGLLLTIGRSSGAVSRARLAHLRRLAAAGPAEQRADAAAALRRAQASNCHHREACAVAQLERQRQRPRSRSPPASSSSPTDGIDSAAFPSSEAAEASEAAASARTTAKRKHRAATGVDDEGVARRVTRRTSGGR